MIILLISGSRGRVNIVIVGIRTTMANGEFLRAGNQRPPQYRLSIKLL